MFKKAVQQGRRAFGARSVHGVREHAKSLRTRLAAFFNIPRKGSKDLAKSSTPAVDLSNLGQAPMCAKSLRGPLTVNRAIRSFPSCRTSCPLEFGVGVHITPAPYVQGKS